MGTAAQSNCLESGKVVALDSRFLQKYLGVIQAAYLNTPGGLLVRLGKTQSKKLQLGIRQKRKTRVWGGGEREGKKTEVKRPGINSLTGEFPKRRGTPLEPNTKRGGGKGVIRPKEVARLEKLLSNQKCSGGCTPHGERTKRVENLGNRQARELLPTEN